MLQLTTDLLTELLGDHEPPCISLYQPTHRRHPENQQDPIRYRNLLREIETSLGERSHDRKIRALLAEFQAFSRDVDFWNHRTDGLAILASPERFHVLELQRPVKQFLVVAESFHVKPLLRILQSADRFQVLCLDRHRASLFEGNRYVLDLVELKDIPATIEDALGGELTEPHQAVASYGLGAGGVGKAMHHGHGSRKDEIDIDLERFFRVIDRAILERHSRPSGLPLMLVALGEYHTPFREISINPFLMSCGLHVNPHSLDPEELRVQAWRAIEPLYLERLAGLIETYGAARSRGLGSDEIVEVARAAVAGRVGTLLVDSDRVVPGRLDPVTGEVEFGELVDPLMEDLLDEVCEAVLRMNGQVIVVPSERLGPSTGLAATYRY